jgi:hypothetical protein
MPPDQTPTGTGDQPFRSGEAADEVYVTIALNKQGRIVYAQRAGQDENKKPHPRQKPHKGEKNCTELAKEYQLLLRWCKGHGPGQGGGHDPCCCWDPGAGEEVCWC